MTQTLQLNSYPQGVEKVHKVDKIDIDNIVNICYNGSIKERKLYVQNRSTT